MNQTDADTNPKRAARAGMPVPQRQRADGNTAVRGNGRRLLAAALVLLLLGQGVILLQASPYPLLPGLAAGFQGPKKEEEEEESPARKTKKKEEEEDSRPAKTKKIRLVDEKEDKAPTTP